MCTKEAQPTASSVVSLLRAAQCPSEIIDQIGGWRAVGVGEGYGVGFEPKTMLAWLYQI